jgi:hypothetical protein
MMKSNVGSPPGPAHQLNIPPCQRPEMTEGERGRLESKIALLERQLAESREEANAIWAPLRGCTPYYNGKLSPNLDDYAEHDKFGEAYRQSKLPLLNRLHPADRKKVSIGAMLYRDPVRFNVNMTHVLALSQCQHHLSSALF